MCGGISIGPACGDVPPDSATLGNLIGDGYRDIPCADPPTGCPSPIPSPDPSAAAQAEPIEVSARSIPIDHVGTYRVAVGRGSLANGILEAATYRLPEPWPVDVTFVGGPPRLVVESLEPGGRPFDNAYEHGRFEGVEAIEASIVFEVKRFDDGAVVECPRRLVR